MNESLPIPPGEPADDLLDLTAMLAEPANPAGETPHADAAPDRQTEHDQFADEQHLDAALAAVRETLQADAEPKSFVAAPAAEHPAPEEHAAAEHALAELHSPPEQQVALIAPPAEAELQAPIEAPPVVPAAPHGEHDAPPAIAEAPHVPEPHGPESHMPEPAPADAAAAVPAAAAASASVAQAALDAVMPAALAPVEHGIGVLVVNLGTPDAPEPTAVRRYLREFLTDPRVIEKKSLLWKMVLNGIILPLRSWRKARDYEKIWNHEKNESPFKTITRSQAEKLASILEPLGKHVIVDWAMRYASPSIPSRLEALIARGCDRILVMPLYPQYAAPTTATVCDEVFKYVMTLRRQPALRFLPAYYEDPYYIEVLASSLKAELKALSFEPDVIVASYHGMPKEYVSKGDPYESQCVRTTQLLREQLGLDESKLIMTYQSRFGRGEWLGPATIKTVKALAKKGVKNVVVLTPGFAADCLETLEEIAVDNARTFKRGGGKNFAVIPCLNDSQAGMLMIWQLAMRELKGWV